MQCQIYIGESVQNILRDLEWRSGWEPILIQDGQITSDSSILNDPEADYEKVRYISVLIGTGEKQYLFFDDEYCDSAVIEYTCAECRKRALYALIENNYHNIDSNWFVSTKWMEKSTIKPDYQKKLMTVTVPQLKISDLDSNKSLFVYSLLEIDNESWKNLKKNRTDVSFFLNKNIAGHKWAARQMATIDISIMADSTWTEFFFDTTGILMESDYSGDLQATYELIGSYLFVKSKNTVRNYTQYNYYRIIWIDEDSFYTIEREGRYPKFLYFKKRE